MISRKSLEERMQGAGFFKIKMNYSRFDLIIYWNKMLQKGQPVRFLSSLGKEEEWRRATSI